MHASDLPIAAALPELRAALAARRSVVLEAPPGAGKSTVAPLALLDEPWVGSRRILMLEPRRLAARAIAIRMASSLGEQVGERVGYRMRLDTRVSRATRIEVVTEGVLTRMLDADPSLEGVALVIFDEFHERSVEVDLALALTLDAREALAPDLRVLVMSATLEVEPVARLLGEAAIVKAEGRVFPVETRYVGHGLPPLPEARRSPGRDAGPRRPPARGAARAADVSSRASAERLTAQIVLRALDETEGDVLAFLPGAAEIRRVQSLLEDAQASKRVSVLPLFGDLEPAAQDAALEPSASGERKVVLATNIAETSLTIEGVRVVVDSGLVRRAIFDPGTGMGRLETERVSRASADQRRGRAGRTAPGVCYRAWSEVAHRSLAPATAPEILSADLAPTALELARWGVSDAGGLRWLDPPPAAMLASARDLLRRLGALDDTGRITAHGREMARLAVHPRLAHMLLTAARLGRGRLAAALAGLLSERDLLRGGAARDDADIRTRLALLEDARRGRDGGGSGAEADRGARAARRQSSDAPRVERGALYRARRFAERLESELDRHRAASGAAAGGAGGGSRGARAAGRGVGGAVPVGGAAVPVRGNALAGDDDAAAGVLLAFAYPDRIGRRRPGAPPRYTLANGRGAMLAEGQRLAREEFLVAVDLDDRDRDARILLAAPLSKTDVETHFADALERREAVEWSSRDAAVVARRTVRLGAVVIDESPLQQVPADAARAAMLTGIRELGLDSLSWTRDARDLRARVEFARGLGLDETADWPAMDDTSLAATLDDWLAPWLDGVTRREHLARIPLADALGALLGPARRRRLDELAPARLEVPSGSHIRIDYEDENAPAVAVRLQEVFGLDESPRVGGGRVPVTFKLLSPAQRPVQVTRDLASFWRGAYADVRKDLRGRYPKHYWPENPLEAEATRRVRPRK